MEGDLGAPSSWGFAAADFPAADAGGDLAISAPEGGAAAAAAAAKAEAAVEVAALREENASLKKELRRAKAEIKRLIREGGGGGGAHAPGGGGSGVATSASTGVLDGGGSGLDGVGVDDAQQGGERRRERKSRTPRESRSRKKMDIHTARATDAVVEAVAAGGGVARPDSGRSLEVDS